MKATPLLLIALGFAVRYRANVGTSVPKGRFVVGAMLPVACVAGGQIDRAVDHSAGGAGGACLARDAAGAIAALLRDRFNANEILVSLMLVYVAELALAYLVYGPRRPERQLSADQDLRESDTDLHARWMAPRVNALVC